MDGAQRRELSFAACPRITIADARPRARRPRRHVAGAFIAPWDWRISKKRRPPSRRDKAARPIGTRCCWHRPPNRRTLTGATSKGNVNTSGECIYHTPDQPAGTPQIKMNINRARAGSVGREAGPHGFRETKR